MGDGNSNADYRWPHYDRNMMDNHSEAGTAVQAPNVGRNKQKIFNRFIVVYYFSYCPFCSLYLSLSLGYFLLARALAEPLLCFATRRCASRYKFLTV